MLFAIKVKREHNIAVFGGDAILEGGCHRDDPDTAEQEHEIKHEQHIYCANSRRGLLTAYVQLKIKEKSKYPNIDFSKKNTSTSHMVTFLTLIGKKNIMQDIIRSFFSQILVAH